MIDSAASFLAWSIAVAEILLGVSLILAAVRVARGPSSYDRIMALDMVAVLSAGAIVLHGVETGEASLIRPAFALALVGFLGSVFFAHTLGRANTDDGKGRPHPGMGEPTREREADDG